MKNFFAFLFLCSIIAGALLILGKDNHYLFTVIPHLSLFSIAMYFIYEKDWQTTLKKLGIPGDIKSNLKYAILGFISFIVVTLLIGIIMSYFSIRSDSEKVATVIKEFPTYLLIFAIFFAPISEELFFRAFLTEKFGIISPAILFAIAHVGYQSYTQLVIAFILGLMLGYVYRRSKSVLPGMAMHLGYNALSILIIRSTI